MSSDDVVIDVRGVSKYYDVMSGDVLVGPSEDVQNPVRSLNTPKKKFRALDDVSFQVARGETVGIVGRNGAGKSTLLRIIAGMSKPDMGGVSIDGQAYSVMGMGVGMQRDLSGAENIRLKASIMGLSKEEIDAKYEGIIAFAELGDYINEPLRTYSKGMRARLAFSITFAFEPEILIVDEALSGGDGSFKRKTQARLQEINESGATILLVSHGGKHHKKLCDRTILIDSGRKIAEGPPQQILRYYQRILATAPNDLPPALEEIAAADPYADYAAAEAGKETPVIQSAADGQFIESLRSQSASASAPRGAEITNAVFRSVDGEPANILSGGQPYAFTIDTRFDKPAKQVYAEITICDDEDTELSIMRSHAEGEGRKKVAKGAEPRFQLKMRNRLLEGNYFVTVSIYGDIGAGDQVLHQVTDMVMFQSLGTENEKVTGLVDLTR